MFSGKHVYIIPNNDYIMGIEVNKKIKMIATMSDDCRIKFWKNKNFFVWILDYNLDIKVYYFTVKNYLL